ncbi:hypothetical protein [Paraburkholderia kirstenboschensis]|uniref:Uncharacterized protein n=1 Tax=Paraburkholderia kirstenboschensis TaxID=1245436 RepID=A0ABZ0EH28_9BURK|nr:hypothetical protein [Paraburkholderia kirstenboschensis]WOD16528.1 hypothetical protein RW095_11555 [Paraburkholderia kirstenboschensis]
MAASERSLRELIEKWLDASGAASARIQLQPGARQGNRRCICVEAQRETGILTLFFFRHGDGLWHVFPPDERPAMRVTTTAA